MYLYNNFKVINYISIFRLIFLIYSSRPLLIGVLNSGLRRLKDIHQYVFILSPCYTTNFLHIMHCVIQTTRPLHSFEGYGDYVYDVKWSPVHPALFASVDGSGRMDFWNINKDTEVFISYTSRQIFKFLISYNKI